MKILFSLVDDRIKLQLIKKNKNLKNLLDINIIQYKRLSKKLKVYEENNKGKEYDCYINEILFKGEYLNNERNGIGKEYNYLQQVIFEGEYKNGKRNGKGKEYYNKNKLKFEGVFLNGKKWEGIGYDTEKNIIYQLEKGKGYIKEYDYSGNLSFEGNYIDGELKGNVKEYYSDGKISFEGEYSLNKRNGFGKEYYYDGKLKFDGKFLYGRKWEGKGFNRDGKIIYKLNDGDGYVQNYLDNGELISEYSYVKGVITGKGKEYAEGKIIFEGQYFNGQRSGNGKEYNNNGQLIFEGEYIYDERKNGKAYIKGSLEYIGEYLYNRKWNGTGYDSNGNVIYVLNNGTGQVMEFENDNLIFDGNYLNGKRDGRGKEYFSNGSLKFKGKYQNDKRNGKGTEYYYNTDIKKFIGNYRNGKRWDGKLIKYEGDKKYIIFYINGKKNHIKSE